MKVIDQSTWSRKSIHDYFRTLPDPQVGVTVNVDVTRLLEEQKPKGVSMFRSVLYALMRGANEVPEFRQRFDGDEVYEFEKVHPSVTVPLEDDRFGFCYVEYSSDWQTFSERTAKDVERAKCQTELADGTQGRLDWIFLSCLPWFSFTSFLNPTHGPNDCYPRITWGRFFQSEGRWKMPVGVQANHALVDGLHIAKFYDNIQRVLDEQDFG